MKVLFIICLCFATTLAQDSCFGRCGDENSAFDCQCNSVCGDFGDCCSDYGTICFSCAGRCNEAYDYSKPCQCNNECSDFGNCCSDYNSECDGGSGTGSTTDLSESLFEKDLSVGDLIVVNPDATQLFVSVDPAALQSDTFQTFIALRDNYNTAECNGETTNQAEIDAFLDAVEATEVWQIAAQYISDNGLWTGDLRTKVLEMWFEFYSRCSGIQDTSGFEHVFIGETKQEGGVGGYHNWVSFYYDEQNGSMDYGDSTGYFIYDSEFSGLEMSFVWNEQSKPISSMYIGSTPEFELAIYTVCWLQYPNALCPVSYGGSAHDIQTWVTDGIYVGSAYPDVTS